MKFKRFSNITNYLDRNWNFHHPTLLEEKDPDQNQTKDIKIKKNLDQLGTSNQ